MMKKKLLLIIFLLNFFSSSLFANKYNLKDPALNKCFKQMLGEKRYQEVIYSNSAKPNEKESI